MPFMDYWGTKYDTDPEFASKVDYARACVSAANAGERWRERASDHARAQQGAQNGTRGSKPSPPSAYAHDSKHQWVSTGKEGKIADWLSSENDCGW